uniref:Inosine-5'-monophosphate dehydrogenase n=1 Tax=Stylophora pistillata TaxID=50429 RepID=A0A2B4R9S4_STYPI
MSEEQFKKVIAHAKAYGYVFTSSEIYEGLSAVYDYGQYGVLLKNNLREFWWKAMVQMEENIVGLDAAILMHPTTWKASGHTDAFNDPLIDNKDSKKRYRADVLIEDYVAKIDAKIEKEIIKATKRFGEHFDREQFINTNPKVVSYREKCETILKRMVKSLEADDLKDVKKMIEELGIVCPVSGSKNWTDVRNFNLMFATKMGASSEDTKNLFLRPETAQGIFVNFLNVQKTSRMKLPFGIAQTGKAFRNEIVARQFVFRMREFEQMEMQFFVPPGKQKHWYEKWKKKRFAWHLSMGLGAENYRFHNHEKLAHYADAAVDIEFKFPFGFKELEAYSEVLPEDVCIKTKFTQNITLNIPIVSAAMDTVTESKMAIAMARLGGIGVLHKSMSIESQVEEVVKVKRSESGMIIDPITVTAKKTVSYAKTLMKKNGIGGIPVIDGNKKLIGIVTNRDLRFEKSENKPISEVMTYQNLISTQQKTDLSEAEEILQQHKIEKLPVVNASNELVGLITFRDIIKIKENPNANKDNYGRLRVAGAIGVTKDSIERATALNKVGVDVLVIDTAHGHTKRVVDTLKAIKKVLPKIDVVVGNIVTADAAKYLVEAGADAVKVGIGPGSICTTRVVTGVGYPQLSAVIQVAEAIKGSGIPVIADGGIRYTGDIAKAIAAGADSVMLGSLLAGTKESPGETILLDSRRYKSYRGMGSVEAMKEGSKDRYFQDKSSSEKLVPEGIVGRVPYKGELAFTMNQFIGGLRASMGYCGAKNISAQQKSKFVKITSSGIAESHPHDITITKEAPNYSR